LKEINKKILAVMQDAGVVKKSGYNGHQKYHYSTEQDINDSIKPELIKKGISYTWSVVDYTFLQDGQFAIVKTAHTFTDVESGESVSINSVGTGSDKTDKAIFKAFTGSCKYAFSKMFMIATDDDPEKEDVVPTLNKSFSKPIVSKVEITAPVNSPKVPAQKADKKLTPTFGAVKPAAKKVTDEDVAF